MNRPARGSAAIAASSLQSPSLTSDEAIAFIHDLKIAGLAIIGAVALAVLVNHLINTNAQTECEALKEFNPPSFVLPANCR